MKQVLSLLVLFAILSLFVSLFLPTQLIVEEEVTIANDSKIVHKKLKDNKLLFDWLQKEQQKKCWKEENKIFWKTDNTIFSYQLLQNTESQVYFEIALSERIETFKGIVEIEEFTGKQTKIHFSLHSSASINPFTRYFYWFKKKKAKQLIQDFLAYFKNEVTKIHYERFQLSESSFQTLNDIVFSIPKRTTPSRLAQSKKLQIDSLLKARLLRYRLLDTLRKPYIQYSDWQKDSIKYNLCIPLLRKPTQRQAYWLKGGKLASVQGKFYTATYKGKFEDIHLAWDSLYQRLKLAKLQPKGLPLEQFVEKTDSTQVQKLFIRLPLSQK